MFYRLRNPEAFPKPQESCIFEQAEISPRVLRELSNATTAYRLCVAGLGCTVVADTFFSPTIDPAVKAYRIGSPAVTNSVVVAYHQKEYLSHAANAMLQTIVDLYPKRSYIVN